MISMASELLDAKQVKGKAERGQRSRDPKSFKTIQNLNEGGLMMIDDGIVPDIQYITWYNMVYITWYNMIYIYI